MKLLDCEPEFVREPHRGALELVTNLDDAQGITMWCPKCDGHQILLWFKDRVPADAVPGPGRWTPSGTGFADLTLSPSVHLTGEGCRAHFWVKAGAIEHC